jgi:hypothetical protein
MEELYHELVWEQILLEWAFAGYPFNGFTPSWNDAKWIVDVLATVPAMRAENV